MPEQPEEPREPSLPCDDRHSAATDTTGNILVQNQYRDCVQHQCGRMIESYQKRAEIQWAQPQRLEAEARLARQTDICKSETDRVGAGALGA